MTPPAPRSEPLAPTLGVREGRDAYLAENGFTTESYTAPWTDASFFGVKFKVPNTPHHRWAIMLHDLHHVATGYGTDLAGEGEVAAWELRRGMRGLGLYVGTIVALGAFAGLVFEPRRTLRAWRRAAGKASLFQDGRAYEELLALSVGELRHGLGVPAQGIAEGAQGLHRYAPSGMTAAPPRVARTT
jgi:hypothetical protein